MNLFRSICCLFSSGCEQEETRPMKETSRGEPQARERDLGQTEAELEKTGKEQMSHMEGGGASKSSQP
jgi:hypothetical protein